MPLQWTSLDRLPATDPYTYACAWCGDKVSSNRGTHAQDPHGRGVVHLRFCPSCGRPTTIGFDGQQVPGLRYGDDVEDLPENLSGLYDEARDCVGFGAHHAAVMVSRKVLMHVAVGQGAEENETFAHYVDYLVQHNLVPPNSKE